jgi:Tfp pilus assembly protein PilN
MKNKKATYICQFAEEQVQVIKYLDSGRPAEGFVALETESLPVFAAAKESADKLSLILKKLQYKNDRVILSLNRQNVTLRILRVPAKTPAEIERMVSLQAIRYLPYSSQDLVTGYQAISTDKEGYTDLILIIAHKDIINRYLEIFRILKIKDFSIFLSSWGLYGLYAYFNPADQGPVFVVEIKSKQVEIAVISWQRFCFSRSFNIPQQSDCHRLLIEELNKTKDAYLREPASLEPKKIFITGLAQRLPELKRFLLQGQALPVEELVYWERIPAAKGFTEDMLKSDSSLAGLVGFGLKQAPESLSLLPQEEREGLHKKTQAREFIRATVYILSAALIFGLALSINLGNKADYLRRLRIELNKVEKEAKPLAQIEKRLVFALGREKKSLSLDLLKGIYQAIPGSVFLASINYDQDKEVILRGQAQELNSVFTFAAQLERSDEFKNFDPKVKYATKRDTREGERIDFEILCLKR